MTTADRAAEKIAAYRDLGFTEAAFIARFTSISAERERETVERLTRGRVAPAGRDGRSGLTAAPRRGFFLPTCRFPASLLRHFDRNGPQGP